MGFVGARGALCKPRNSKLDFRILARSLGDCQDLGDSRLCFRVFKGTITYWLNLETRNSISELKNTFPGHRPLYRSALELRRWSNDTLLRVQRYSPSLSFEVIDT